MVRTENFTLAGNAYTISINFNNNELKLAKNGKWVDPISIFDDNGIFEYISVQHYFSMKKMRDDYYSDDKKICLAEAENIIRDAAIDHIKKLANMLPDTTDDDDYSNAYDDEINKHTIVISDAEKKTLADDYVFITVKNNPLRGCFINKYNGEFFKFKRMGLDKHFPVFTRKELYVFGIIPMDIEKSNNFLKKFGYVIDRDWRLPRKRGDLAYFEKLYAERSK